MVRIKFQRIGKKKQPHFRIIVQERGKNPKSKSVEILGWLNPRSKENEIRKERVEYWLSVGAQPTNSVHNLFVKEGILKEDKKKSFKISKKRKIKMSKKQDKNKKNESVGDVQKLDGNIEKELDEKKQEVAENKK